MNAQRILIVDNAGSDTGKVVANLNKIGYDTTGYFSVNTLPEDLHRTPYDLVAFGSDVKPAVKQLYEDAVREANPNVISLTGIYPSAPLMADQVKLAMHRRKQAPGAISHINYDINEGCLSVALRAVENCQVEIGLYRIGLFYGTDEQILFSEKLKTGDRFVNFDEGALSGFGAKFLIVRVNGNVFFMQRL